MSPEEEKYYETQLDMFLSEGWKHFAGQLEQMREACDTIKSVEPEDLRFKQGELSIIEWVLDWPEQVKRAYEELQLEDKEEADAQAGARAA